MSGPVVEQLERSGRLPWSRRRRLLVLVGAILLAGLAWLVDARVQRTERAAVGNCAERVQQDIRVAGRRVWAVVGYAGPTVSVMPDGPERDGVYDLVAAEAVGVSGRLEPVRRQCADVGVVWWHGELGERRTACLGRVAAYQDLFDAIAADGSQAFSGFSAESCA